MRLAAHSGSLNSTISAGCLARQSGGAFLSELRIIVVARASRLDLGNFQHAQAKQKIPHQRRMAGMQTGRKDEAGRSGTGAAGSARLRTLPALPVRGRQSQQPVHPVRRPHPLFPGAKCHKCFVRCHDRSLRCCAEEPVSHGGRSSLRKNGRAAYRDVQACSSSIVCARKQRPGSKKYEQSTCHFCRVLGINALPEPEQFFCARPAPGEGKFCHRCAVPVHTEPWRRLRLTQAVKSSTAFGESGFRLYYEHLPSRAIARVRYRCDVGQSLLSLHGPASKGRADAELRWCPPLRKICRLADG